MVHGLGTLQPLNGVRAFTELYWGSNVLRNITIISINNIVVIKNLNLNNKYTV